jgi:glycosyltransferase involved in cell wall biosynthesis
LPAFPEMEKEMDKIKILYLVSTLKKCGPMNILYGIIAGLDRSKFDIYILSLSAEGKDSALDMFKALRLKIYQLNNSRLLGLFKNKRKVQNLVYKLKIDMIHSHGIRADQINSRLKNVIRLNTIHNFPAEDYTFRYGKSKGMMMEILHKMAIKKLEHPIACSKTISDKFNSLYGIATNFVQNGIDTNRFFPDTKLKHELKMELGLPPDKRIFIVSSALTLLKNPQIIVEAFNQIRDPDVFLLFIGNGELLRSLAAKNKNDSIVFKGKINNVSDHLKASDYFVSASLTEGLPNSVLEALGTGLPAILSKIPAHIEIVGPSYPYFFDPEDVADLHQKMEKVLNTQRIEMNSDLVEKINSEFSAPVMSEKYASLYLKSMNNKTFHL